MHSLNIGRIACLLTVAAAACSDSESPDMTTAMPDAGTLTDAGTPDAGEPDMGEPDMGMPLQPSTLFGACVEDSQCPGEGAICRKAAETGNPGGFCTVPCEDRTPCDFANIYHFCTTRVGETQSYCERRCLNGLDCGRSSYTCQLLPPDEEEGICFGLCDRDDQCGEGSRCEPYSAQCVPVDAVDEGATNGEPCTERTDCRSTFCISEIDNGWPGGSCISQCILPSGFNNSNFFGGDTLPQAACPENNLCIPLLGSFTRGDPGACMRSCTTPADCRQGYTCRNQFEGGGGISTFTNGVCWPEG